MDLEKLIKNMAIILYDGLMLKFIFTSFRGVTWTALHLQLNFPSLEKLKNPFFVIIK